MPGSFRSNAFRTFVIFFSAVILALPAKAVTIETAAKHAFLIDADTQTVLLNKAGDERMHPSSMSKLMTSYVLFSRLKEERLKLNDHFTVSEKAWKTQGSKTFVHVGDAVAIEDLIRGIIVQSGNDACVTVAEGISGSEEAFAKEMNRIAAEIGLSSSHFVNATGWPDDEHQMTARDLATLAQRLISDFPEYYHYYSIREFTYAKIKQQNRNPLLGSDLGVDGLKTGHTEAAGCGITLSAKQKDRRVILVLNGLASETERKEEGDKLLRWAFREFENRKLASAGDLVDEAAVWFGIQKTVPLLLKDDVLLTLPVSLKNEARFTLKYNGPVAAPVAKDSHIADLLIEMPGMPSATYPLVAGADVPKLSGFSYLLAKLRYSLTGSY